MCQIDYNTERVKNKHLTYEERIKIETLYKIKDENNRRIYSISEIARIINVNKSAISREIKRGEKTLTTKGGYAKIIYSAEKANGEYKYNRAQSHNTPLVYKDGNLKKFIEEKILKENWSPEAIAGYLKNNGNKYNFNTNICAKTIYNNIHNNNLKVKPIDMRRMVKIKQNKKEKNHEQKESKKEKSIHLRGENINNRTEFGHWEMDCVCGKREKCEVLLTLTERKTRYELIFKIPNKTSISVVESIDKIKVQFGELFSIIFKSITVDNGSEFSDRESLEKNCNTFIYYADPYCSGQRGTNENHNGIIRWFIKKGTPIEKYSIDKIKEIQNWMNNYPRKIFDFKTPKEKIRACLDELDININEDLFFAL